MEDNRISLVPQLKELIRQNTHNQQQNIYKKQKSQKKHQNLKT